MLLPLLKGKIALLYEKAPDFVRGFFIYGRMLPLLANSRSFPFDKLRVRMTSRKGAVAF
jgi:hypothetical protein